MPDVKGGEGGMGKNLALSLQSEEKYIENLHIVNGGLCLATTTMGRRGKWLLFFSPGETLERERERESD